MRAEAGRDVLGGAGPGRQLAAVGRHESADVMEANAALYRQFYDATGGLRRAVRAKAGRLAPKEWRAAHPVQGYCGCADARGCPDPRAIYWSHNRELAWCHTDGFPCPSSAGRLAPEPEEWTLF